MPQWHRILAARPHSSGRRSGSPCSPLRSTLRPSRSSLRLVESLCSPLPRHASGSQIRSATASGLLSARLRASSSPGAGIASTDQRVQAGADAPILVPQQFAEKRSVRHVSTTKTPSILFEGVLIFYVIKVLEQTLKCRFN